MARRNKTQAKRRLFIIFDSMKILYSLLICLCSFALSGQVKDVRDFNFVVVTPNDTLVSLKGTDRLFKASDLMVNLMYKSGDTVFLKQGSSTYFVSGIASNQELSYSLLGLDSLIIEISDGNQIRIPRTDLDANPFNELQTLAIGGDTIFISDGNFVKVPPSTSLLQFISVLDDSLVVAIQGGNQVSAPIRDIVNTNLDGVNLLVDSTYNFTLGPPINYTVINEGSFFVKNQTGERFRAANGVALKNGVLGAGMNIVDTVKNRVINIECDTGQALMTYDDINEGVLSRIGIFKVGNTSEGLISIIQNNDSVLIIDNSRVQINANNRPLLIHKTNSILLNTTDSEAQVELNDTVVNIKTKNSYGTAGQILVNDGNNGGLEWRDLGRNFDRTQWSMSFTGSITLNNGSTFDVLDSVHVEDKVSNGTDVGGGELTVTQDVRNYIQCNWQGVSEMITIRVNFDLNMGGTQTMALELRRQSDNSLISSIPVAHAGNDYDPKSATFTTYIGSALDPFVTSGFYIQINNQTGTNALLESGFNVLIARQYRTTLE